MLLLSPFKILYFYLYLCTCFTFQTFGLLWETEQRFYCGSPASASSDDKLGTARVLPVGGSGGLRTAGGPGRAAASRGPSALPEPVLSARGLGCGGPALLQEASLPRRPHGLGHRPRTGDGSTGCGVSDHGARCGLRLFGTGVSRRPQLSVDASCGLIYGSLNLCLF